MTIIIEIIIYKTEPKFEKKNIVLRKSSTTYFILSLSVRDKRSLPRLFLAGLHGKSPQLKPMRSFHAIRTIYCLIPISNPRPKDRQQLPVVAGSGGIQDIPDSDWIHSPAHLPATPIFSSFIFAQDARVHS